MGYAEKGDRLGFLTPGADPHIIFPDVIVIRPIREWLPEHTEQARAAGQVVIADLDDDVWHHQAWTPEGRPNDDHYDDWLPGVDALLVSTRALAKVVKKRLPDLPVYVAPNCYDPYGLSATPGPGRLIGTRMWTGSRMEVDLELYDSLVYPLLAELDLKFVHVGADAEQSFTKRGWDPARLIERPSTTVPGLRESLGDLSVGVICMGEHAYNAAKTETHAIELASVGLPLVAASEHRLYIGIPGRVDHTPGAVRFRMHRLVNDPDFWHQEAERAVAWARLIAATAEDDYLSTLRRVVDLLISK